MSEEYPDIEEIRSATKRRFTESPDEFVFPKKTSISMEITPQKEPIQTYNRYENLPAVIDTTQKQPPT